MSSVFPIGSVLKVTRYDTHEDIRRNLQLMKDHGLNTVVIWPAAFWWEEKGPDYPFATGKFILQAAEEIGIFVIMELAGQLTSMEYMPDFLLKPEYQTMKLDGGRERGQSSFGFVNYFHPEVRKIIEAHYEKAAKAYKDYDALVGYDVFNETMYRSFDPWTMKEFQTWLQEKYGTVERLNEVWERTYTDFSQVEYEDWKWMSIMPQADYCMFRKVAIGRFLKPWCEAIKRVDPEHLLIGDNIHSQVTLRGDYGRPQDDYGLQETVSQLGMSFYPKGVSGCMPEAERWEVFDGFYDATGRKGFFISEMQTHVQALFNPTTCVRLYELKQWCMEAYAAGAKALIYWMWRPFDKGLQTLGRGLVNYREIPTERLHLAGELSKLFSEYGAVKPAASDVAILYDPMCEDFQRRLTESYAVEQDIYLRAIYGAYQALFDANLRADIIRIGELSNYKAVILTEHIKLSEEDGKQLRAYVAQGGHLIIDGKFGIVDETSLMHKRLPGGPVNDLIGGEFFDTDNEDNRILLHTGGEEVFVPGFMGRDLLVPGEAEVLHTFPDGKPAVLRKKTGKGSVTFIATSLCYGYEKNQTAAVRSYLVRLLADCNVLPLTDSVLKLRLAEAEGKKLLFVFNYTDAPVEEDLKLCIDGKPYVYKAGVDAQDVKIIEL